MHNLVLILLATLFTLLNGGCATREPIELEPDEEVELTGTTFSQDLEDPDFELFAGYRIQPGDVLDVLFQIQTWIKKDRFEVSVDHTVTVKFVNAPELNEEQRVRPDGHISLPYLGEYYVVGKTVGEIHEELTRLYKRELKDPELYVLVPEFREAIKELKKDLHTAPRGLSRLVTVRPDGVVTFPMVGEIKVAGEIISEVNVHLNEEYEKILPGLHVDLFLERHSGSVVYVLGEVNQPGAYPIVRPINLLQALSLAESYKPGARLDSVVVIRRYGQKMTARRIDLNQTLTFKENQHLFYVQPDDIVLVPKTRIARSAEVMRDIMSIFMFRGWSISLDTTTLEF